MTNKQWERRLAQAMGTLRPETDFDTVAGAIPAPATEADAVIHRHSLRRYVAAVAAAAVMVTGVGVWWYTRPADKPPVTQSDASPDTATSTTGNTTVTTDGTSSTTGGTVSTTDGITTTTGTVAPTKPTTKPTTPPVTPPKAPVTSLKEAKAAIADGRYEVAYLYLLTDNSKEAVELLEKFVYVPVGKTDANNGTSSWTYDEMGLPEMESVEDESAGVRKQTQKIYTYDPQGRVKTKTLLTIMDGEETYRQEYIYTYDDAGYLVREDYNTYYVPIPTRCTKVYTYDERGNRIREEHVGEECSGNITTYTYDEANRLLVKLESYVESGGWHKQEYVYDAAGRVLKKTFLRSDGDGDIYEYTYDESGVQTSYFHTLLHEPNHWQKWYMDGNQTVYEYKHSNTGNYEKYIEEDGKAVYRYSIRYDTLTNKYGVFQDKALVSESESFYNERGNLLREIEWHDYHPSMDDDDYGVCRLGIYDDKGNCVESRQYTFTNREDPEGSAGSVRITATYVYVYDEAGRVLEYQRTDSQGKVSTHVYAYDAAGRIIKDGSYTKKGVFLGDEYTYDAAGRVLIYKKTYNTDYWHCTTYTYDEAGHKIGVEYTSSTGTWTKYTYDAAGNLLRKEDNEGVIYACTWELRYYPDGLTAEHRQELEEFRNATGGDEIFDDSGSDFEGGLVDA